MVKVGWSILCWGWGKLMLSGSVSINFYLINKYGIIREEILCIIHVFTIRSIQQIWFTISTYTTSLTALTTFMVLLSELLKHLKKKRIWWSKEEKTVDVLRLPQSQWRRWPATPDFFCVDCLTSGQIRRSKNPILNIFYIYKTFT